MSATSQHLDDPVRAGRPSPARTPATRWPLVIGATALLVVLAFGGGFAVANATSAKPTGRAFGGGASGQAGGGGGAFGTVTSVSGTQMTVSTQAGGSKIVLLAPSTTVTQVTSTPVAVSNIANGNQVTVIGTANPDGSITANQVILGNAGIFGRGGNRSGAASPAPSTAP